ncbi:hypothetical protein GGX14DRAFT_399649 [Mycena pura]|uniref:Uncharacterized protein n=1 Tax=Mycena pura TaxID=153505 RepID=A0AAD6V4D6_9AGAR|nr:hypothetical protein GGX14DRAFT_399649 [Mycena pura]
MPDFRRKAKQERYSLADSLIPVPIVRVFHGEIDQPWRHATDLRKADSDNADGEFLRGAYLVEDSNLENIWEKAYEDRRDMSKRYAYNQNEVTVQPRSMLDDNDRSVIIAFSAVDEEPGIRQDVSASEPVQDVDIEQHVKKWALNREQRDFNGRMSIAPTDVESASNKKGQQNILRKLLWLSVKTVVILKKVERIRKWRNELAGEMEHDADAVRFLDLLGRLRQGRCTDDDFELLNSRFITKLHPDWDSLELQHTVNEIGDCASSGLILEAHCPALQLAERLTFSG